MPHWVKSASDGKLRATKLVHVKSDNVGTSTAFRDAWLNNQRCIVPMQAFITDDYRSSGKPKPTRIARVDGLPMGVAGIWARWQDEDGSELLRIGDLAISTRSHTVRRGDTTMNLTPLEFDLLVALARRPRQVLSRELLLEEVWGYKHAADTRLVNVHVQRLRAKVEADPERPEIIITVRGVGYRAGEQATGKD